MANDSSGSSELRFVNSPLSVDPERETTCKTVLVEKNSRGSRRQVIEVVNSPDVPLTVDHYERLQRYADVLGIVVSYQPPAYVPGQMADADGKWTAFRRSDADNSEVREIELPLFLGGATQALVSLHQHQQDQGIEAEGDAELLDLMADQKDQQEFTRDVLKGIVQRIHREFIAPPKRRDQERPSVPLHPTLQGLQLKGEIGRGAMGIVYLVERGEYMDMSGLKTDPLPKQMALKICKPESHSSLSDRERFQSEIAAISQSGLQVFWTSHSHMAVLMEYVPNDGTMQSVIESGMESSLTDEKISIMETFLRELHAHHADGIVNGDLKPSNTLLRGVEYVRILDWGLVDGAKSHGEIAGTPSYLSPEQARGEVLHPTLRHKLDTFSAGLTCARLCAEDHVGFFGSDFQRDVQTLSEKIANYSDAYFEQRIREMKIDPVLIPFLHALMKENINDRSIPRALQELEKIKVNRGMRPTLKCGSYPHKDLTRLYYSKDNESIFFPTKPVSSPLDALSSHLSLTQKREMAAMTLAGLQRCHRQGQIVGDVRLRDLHFDGIRARVDISRSKDVKNEDPHEGFGVHFLSAAPEVLKSNSPGHRTQLSDTYSVGAACYELLALRTTDDHPLFIEQAARHFDNPVLNRNADAIDLLGKQVLPTQSKLVAHPDQVQPILASGGIEPDDQVWMSQLINREYGEHTLQQAENLLRLSF